MRVWSARRESGAVRTALARLAVARAPSDARALRLVPDTSYLHMQPALMLHVSEASLIVEKKLDCVACLLCQFHFCLTSYVDFNG